MKRELAMKSVTKSKCDYHHEELTFVYLLKACAKRRDPDEGARLHADILKKGFLEKNPHIASTLISMYAKCGLFGKAQKILKDHFVKDLVSWNALIAGYAEQKECNEALKCLELMQNEGLYPNKVTFICLLKSCQSIGAIGKGILIHNMIVKAGILDQDVVVGTSLVDMYVKCGLLVKAHSVLEEIPLRNVASWNALITGYVQHRDFDQALNCYKCLQRECIFPDAITFTCILKACGIKRLLGEGMQIHNKLLNNGSLKKDVVLGNALVDMYVKCSVFERAEEVLEGLFVRDVVSWNALILEYVQQGYGYKALNSFEHMQNEGFSPNITTLIYVLKACTMTGATDKGKWIHLYIMNMGFLEKDIVLMNALSEMYAKGNLLCQSIELFEQLPVRNIDSWNVMIIGNVQRGQDHEALNAFEYMQIEGLFPDVTTFISILKACSGTRSLELGEKIYQVVVEKGLFRNNMQLSTALVDMYARSGAFAKAQEVIEMLPIRSSISWNALITGYTQDNHYVEALHCFEQMQAEGLSPNAITFTCMLRVCGNTNNLQMGRRIHNEISGRDMLSEDPFLGTSLVDMYCKCDMFRKAQEVLDQLPFRSVASCNAIITGYTEQGQFHEAWACFQQIENEGLLPNSVTFVCMLKACSKVGNIQKAKQLHNYIVNRKLLQKDPVLGNALLDMFVKCYKLQSAAQVFEGLPVRDTVSWNEIIGGYVQQEHPREALSCFQQMQGKGFSANVVTFIYMLKACGCVGAVGRGKEIHTDIINRCLLEKNIVLGSVLVNMYAKCGMLVTAERVLEELPIRNVFSWSALIAGYAQQGQDYEALVCVEQMQNEGIFPNTVTFISILKACSSMGVMDVGNQIHEQVMKLSLWTKDLMLCNAMIDMYAKCGVLAEAHKLFDILPVQNVASWNAIIAGYARHGKHSEAINLFKKCEDQYKDIYVD